MQKYTDSIEQRLTARHKKCLKFCGSLKGKVILDIGCYNGWFEKFAVKKGCQEIWGIDTNKKHLLAARDRVKNKRAKFLEASALNLSMFKKNYFDKVVMWDVLEHLPKGSEERALQEINRVLKTGGILYISTPNRTFWSCVLDPAWWLIGHRHYNVAQIEKLAKKTGFEIEKVEYGGGFFELISMILLYIFKWVFRREIPFNEFLERKRKLEYFGEGKIATVFIKLRLKARPRQKC